MNYSPAHCRRFARLFLVLCFFGTSLLADLPSNPEQSQKDLGICTAKVDQHRSELTSSEEGIKRLATLDHHLHVMKGCLDRLSELSGELKTQDSRMRDLKMLELEPKQRDLEQIRQSNEARFSRLRYEKQALETEIVQHNNKPHVFYDSQLMERANYIAERSALEARWQRLIEAATLIQTEMQPRVELASRAVAKAQQDFNDAVARRAKTAQLLQEQAFHYANTRSILVEELAKLDHGAARASQ